MRTTSIFILICALSLSTLWSQGTQLLRQPTLSSEYIVFVYANDLWIVSRDGGEARRLTSNAGEESNPHFSPDEQWIAFTGQYGGNTDVYVMPATGGEPQRLTWHPGGDYVQGWTPDGAVLFRSGRAGHPTQTNKFYAVSPEGGLPQALDIPRAAFGELSPDGSHLAYVPITFWDPEWRNYRGGQAMPIWIVDMETKELVRTPQPTQERHLDPVWFQDKVYYLSERDYASNVWMFDPATREEKQLTYHRQFDVKSLDAGPDALVYEQGGYLHLLDPVSGTSAQVVVEVKGDMNFARSRWEDVSASDLAKARVSPTGQRALFEYRGEIFTLPKENGSWRNLTNSPGIADRSPVWSPQGDKIAWFSDASGEYILQIADQRGSVLQTIELPAPTFFFEPDWSPDGQYLAFTDTDYRIWVVAVASGTAKVVDTDRYAHPNRTMNPVWSPDSKWIAYARQLDSHFKAAFAFNVATEERIQLTDGMADVITPVWDQGGEHLYFLASTDYGLNSGWLDMSSYDPDVNRSLYALLLNQEVASPTLAQSDEEEPPAAEDNGEDQADGEEEDVTIRIDTDGLMRRVVALNLPERNYTGLLAGAGNRGFVVGKGSKEAGGALPQ